MSRFATPIRNQSFSTYSEKAHQPKIPIQNKPGYRICYNEAKGVSMLGGSGHILEILKDGDLKTIKSSDKESPIEKTKILKLSTTKFEREDRTKQLKPSIQSQIRSSSPKSLNTIHNGSLRNLLTEQTITVRTRSHSASSSRSYLSTTPSSEPLKYTPPSLGNNVTSHSSFSSSNERTRSLRQIFPSPDRFPSPWRYKLCITATHTKDNCIDNNITNSYIKSSNRKQLIRQSPPPVVSCSTENNNLPRETQDLSHINDEKITPPSQKYNYSPATTLHISMLSLDELADKITNSTLNKIFDEIVVVNNHNNNNIYNNNKIYNIKKHIDKELLNTDIVTAPQNNSNNILSQSTIKKHHFTHIPQITFEDLTYELTL